MSTAFKKALQKKKEAEKTIFDEDLSGSDANDSSSDVASITAEVKEILKGNKKSEKVESSKDQTKNAATTKDKQSDKVSLLRR